MVLCEKSNITTKDLPFEFFIPKQEPEVSNTLSFLKNATANFEKEIIQAALKKSEGNQTTAAKLLGIHRNTLLTKIEQLGVKKNEKI